MQQVFAQHTGKITLSKQSAHFSLRRLQRHFKQNGRNIVRYPDLLVDVTPEQLVAYSSSGIIVHWGEESPQIDALMSELAECDAVEDALNEPYIASYEYLFEPGVPAVIDEVTDVISIPVFDLNSLVALSSAYVKSVQIDYNELVVDRLVEELKFVPSVLAKRGVVRMKGKKAGKLLGKILVVQHTLSTSLLAKDYPEYVWQNPDHVAFYKMVVGFFDVQERWEVLREKLEILHSTAELLRSDKESSTMLFLEWIIVLLFILDIAVYLFEGWL
ncbi:MAG: hypothetical protein COW24_04555 [Candidatus Kerfeldbacteria bacterium CG15_BIG_FIL_POST_REV_8_21_14_020_45_12]|uniref:DUF155 domain-containing protein n=1 Tax=Candidatus Kerfeldbacteria bacterium CG15_BIG_FIL_POST_REV_8_21_14_020_45_12 TaxID=2014247 RepID=A0A2M7H2Z8_9BACT|nr:MAG: hypothetical protein COW24_04555 [Candidatus Kerfeldbacteria bacterium CG15_BIG_FIL_POST_REV_8_21_14_020_45_12]PJA93363.1 MAG: hypothetical protein CO132_03330 [Candidatus Kerfeldbacteria bacterium CG_4_9_14_3_um_filter_45_8]